MIGRRNPFVAGEGTPFIVILIILIVVVLRFGDVLMAVPLLILLAYLALVFRDPRRTVSAVPLGVVSPVDGVVTDVGLTDQSFLNGEAHKVVIRVNSFGTYTARSPVEGKVMEFGEVTRSGWRATGAAGLWLKTDEGDDVVLQFHGHRFSLAPLAFARFGERVGQGQRCAYLRLTRFAEVQLPIDGRMLVEPGEKVVAGETVLAKLHHP